MYHYQPMIIILNNTNSNLTLEQQIFNFLVAGLICYVLVKAIIHFNK